MTLKRSVGGFGVGGGIVMLEKSAVGGVGWSGKNEAGIKVERR